LEQALVQVLQQVLGLEQQLVELELELELERVQLLAEQWRHRNQQRL
jgi:hypothetical protein